MPRLVSVIKQSHSNKEQSSPCTKPRSDQWNWTGDLDLRPHKLIHLTFSFETEFLYIYHWLAWSPLYSQVGLKHRDLPTSPSQVCHSQWSTWLLRKMLKPNKQNPKQQQQQTPLLKKTAPSTKCWKTGCRHGEEWNWILIAHPPQKSTPDGSGALI